MEPNPHESPDGDETLTLAEHIAVAEDLMDDVATETDPAEQRYLLQTALDHYEQAEQMLGRVTRTLNESLAAVPHDSEADR